MSEPWQPPSELDILRFDWDEVYSIMIADGQFSAAKRGDCSNILTADTVGELRRKIVADYATGAVRPKINNLGAGL